MRCLGDALSDSQSCWCHYKKGGGQCIVCNRPYLNDYATLLARANQVCAQCWSTFHFRTWGSRPCNGQGCQEAIRLHAEARQMNNQAMFASLHPTQQPHAAVPYPPPAWAGPQPAPPPPAPFCPATIVTPTVTLTPAPGMASSPAGVWSSHPKPPPPQAAASSCSLQAQAHPVSGTAQPMKVNVKQEPQAMQVQQEAKPHSYLKKSLSTLEEPIPKQPRVDPRLAQPQTVSIIRAPSESYRATLNRLVFAEQFPQQQIPTGWMLAEQVDASAMSLPVPHVTEPPVLRQRPYSHNDVSV